MQHAGRRRSSPAPRADSPGYGLDVTLDPVGDLPFAALRSMFVTGINNDVAQIGWRVKGAQSWERAHS